MTRPVYITLSSIPPRFPHLGPVLQSLIRQEGADAPVLLYIPLHYRRFPDWDGTLPEVPEGVEIIRVDQDDGPATKVLPALRQFAGQDVNILFCDDDNLFPADWLAGYLQASAEHPEAVIAASGTELRSLEGLVRPQHRQPRAQRWTDEALGAYLASQPAPLPMERPPIRSSGFMDTFYGRGGVMVQPRFFNEEVFDLPPVIWAVDDYWLSGHLEAAGIDIWVDHRIPYPMSLRCIMLIRPLVTDVIEGHDRWAANRACIEWFRKEKGIWQPGSPAEPPALWYQKQQAAARRRQEQAKKRQAKPKPRPSRWKRVMRALLGP